MNEQKKRRNTRQRTVVLEELQKLTSHPTAAELYEIVRRRLPSVSLGTVYRNLELLARLDIIQKLELGGAEARFDGNNVAHHHVRCLECGRVGDLNGLDVPAEQLPITLPREENGFTILGYKIMFYGICPHCKTQGTQNPNNNTVHR